MPWERLIVFGVVLAVVVVFAVITSTSEWNQSPSGSEEGEETQ